MIGSGERPQFRASEGNGARFCEEQQRETISRVFIIVTNQKKGWLSSEEALARLQKYCAYQDRCHEEVRRKLVNLGVYGDRLEEVMAELIAGNFLNEERFARSFARGKFRMKNWGRIRIQMELKARRVSEYCIRKALDELPDDEYRVAAEKVIKQKFASAEEADAYKTRKKVVDYAIRKGYEPELVWEIVQRLQP